MQAETQWNAVQRGYLRIFTGCFHFVIMDEGGGLTDDGGIGKEVGDGSRLRGSSGPIEIRPSSNGFPKQIKAGINLRHMSRVELPSAGDLMGGLRRLNCDESKISEVDFLRLENVWLNEVSGRPRQWRDKDPVHKSVVFWMFIRFRVKTIVSNLRQGDRFHIENAADLNLY